MASDNVVVVENLPADLGDSPVIVFPEPQWQEQYSYDDRVVIFQVEDVLFKVHPHVLVGHSQSFRSKVEEHLTMFAKDMPIKLEGITSAQFKHLLDFYHRGMHFDYDPPLTVWISLLTLATRFEFPHLRTRAICEIESDSHSDELHPIDKIVLSHDCGIEEWLVPCYEALCQRPEGLDDEEGAKIGMKTTNRIWRAREALRSPPEAIRSTREEAVCGDHTGSVWKIRTFDEHTVSRIVHGVFGLTPKPLVHSVVPSMLKKKKKGKRGGRDSPYVACETTEHEEENRSGIVCWKSTTSYGHRV